MSNKLSDDLREKGLRSTASRRAVLQLLFKNKHLTAEQMTDKLQKIGFDINIATTYRVLSDFEEVGLVQKNTFDNKLSVFELMPKDHHDHMICTNCGKVIEFHNSQIESIQLGIAEEHKFELINHIHNLFGLCEKCRD